MTTPVQSAAIPFPNAPNPDAADAKNERLRDATIAEMIASGVSPDEIMVPVPLRAGTQYRDPRTGTIGTVAAERQYKALEKQNADKLRANLEREADDCAACADRMKAEVPEMRRQIAAWEAERDAMSEGDGRRILVGRQIERLRESLVNATNAEVANREAAKDVRAAAKAVKVEPIPRPVRWLAKSELDREQKRARRKAENNGVEPAPYLSAGPRPGSDEFFGIGKT
jgi:hypothetical protein